MTHQSSPAYSFGGRTKAQVEPSYMHSPGPGSYKISSSDFRAHSTGFGKGPRNPMTNKSLSPAPG